MLTATIALVATGFVAGVAGSWSPCGLSVVDTIARSAAARWTRMWASVAFAGGALSGGALLFGVLGALGRLAGGGGHGSLVAAAVVAAAAAVGDGGGAAVRPQIRRQVPEPWRRLMPLPLALAAYGVLLGLAFTTFVLSFAAWAVAAISVAVGDPRVGIAIGLAFGAGRALPVLVLVAARSGESLAERPSLLRRCRLAAACALALSAFTLAGEAAAATRIADDARDPSTAGSALVWESSAGAVLVRTAEERQPRPEDRVVIPGRDPAVGGSLLAWRAGADVVIVRAADLSFVARFSLPGAEALAVSDRWIVFRRRTPARSELVLLPVDGSAGERVLAAARAPAQLGRPALDGDRVVFHVSLRRESRIVVVDLAEQRRSVVRRSRTDQLTQPSLLGHALLYVRQTETRQRLVLARLGARRERVVYSIATASRRDAGFEPGHSHKTLTPRIRRPARVYLWTTALSARYAYATLVPVRAALGPPRLIRIPR